ncbi:hypothetical protein L9F63_011183, partial [Diploptera punctata]
MRSGAMLLKHAAVLRPGIGLIAALLMIIKVFIIILKVESFGSGHASIVTRIICVQFDFSVVRNFLGLPNTTFPEIFWLAIFSSKYFLLPPTLILLIHSWHVAGGSIAEWGRENSIHSNSARGQPT